ncbi:dihydrolipoyl dehydrogenase [Neorhizobium sp. NPDC001467]|uniref:dihydrolipoyl dehydrogenase n=1 Tax=Neorhizobium sp. NPDC001467 TaxID=3390595 RepID=UPI003D03C552
MTDLNCDVAIIGAGTAGLSAERSARRAGARTLLIDDRFAGTTCASVGCMPSKLLIAAGKAAHHARQAETFGIHAQDVAIDGRAVMRRVQDYRDSFVASTIQSIEELPPESRLQGFARFVAADRLQVSERTIRAKSIVIATGSSSAVPPAFQGLSNVHTNADIFDMPDLPASLAVIGAGPLGLELAQAFAHLGVDVAVFDEGDSVAALKDAHVAAALRGRLETVFALHLGSKVTADADREGIAISWTGKSSGRRVFSRVLIAAGRPPNLKGLDLDEAGIELDDHGTPVFDRTTMQCGSSAIFMAGDCNADVPVLHEASAEGAIAGNNAARYPNVRASRRTTPLAITFTEPASASIGAEADADSIIGAVSFDDQGRAKVEASNTGLLRIYADREGRLTGAAMAAPAAEHMAHLLAWAVTHRQTAMQLLELPIYHPTYEEGLRSALRDICGQMDISPPDDRDQGSAPGN